MATRLDKDVDTSGIDPNTFLRVYREIRAAKKPMETAIAVYRNARKKAISAGVDEFSLSIMERLAKMEADAAGAALRKLFNYARWTNTDLGVSQGDLFDAAPEQEPSTDAAAAYREQLAEEAGIAAGRAGEKIEANPHPGGSPHHVAWVRGWHRGQEDAVHAAFGGRTKPTGSARRSRNPAAETRDVIGATSDKLDAEPAGEKEGGEKNALGNPIAPLAAEASTPQVDNVFPLEARRTKPKKAAAAPAPAAKEKASKKAAKAAAALAGEPVVGGNAAISGATAF